MSTPPIVIIAEPDPMISSVLRVEFTHWDFAVFLAASGPEAEDYAAHAVAHLVVLDTRLHMAAYEACVRIRRRPGYAGRPIVLTANEASPKVRAVAAEAGATMVLPKPYSVSDLVNALRPHLPPDDLLFTHRAKASGMGESREWLRAPSTTPQSGGDFGLDPERSAAADRAGQGVSIPLVKKPPT